RRYPTETTRPNCRPTGLVRPCESSLESLPLQRRRSLHRRRSLFTGYGVVDYERSASPLDDRWIQQLAIECDGAETLQSCPFKRIDDASCMRNLLGAWAKHVIDPIDLSRMDQRLSAEPEPSRLQRVAAEALLVGDIRPDPVDRLPTRRDRRDDHRGARV